MEYFPAALQDLADQFARLPGIGGKSAQRLAFHVLGLPEDEAAEFAEAILNAKDASTIIGVQNGTTGQFYVEGDEGWGFAGYPVTCTGYKNGSMAVQDLVNGNIQYVIIDSAPAAAITEAINEMN